MPTNQKALIGAAIAAIGAAIAYILAPQHGESAMQLAVLAGVFGVAGLGRFALAKIRQLLHQ